MMEVYHKAKPSSISLKVLFFYLQIAFKIHLIILSHFSTDILYYKDSRVNWYIQKRHDSVGSSLQKWRCKWNGRRMGKNNIYNQLSQQPWKSNQLKQKLEKSIYHWSYRSLKFCLIWSMPKFCTKLLADIHMLQN